MNDRLAHRPRRAVLSAIAVTAVLAVVPPLLSSAAFRLGQYEYILAIVIVAIGLNIALGFTGLLALGPGAVFMVGGYAAVLLGNTFPGSAGLILMALVATSVGAVSGLVIGWPALRIGGFYLGMISLIVAVVVPVVAGNWSFTGGSTGISLLANINWNRHLNGTFLYEVIVAITMLAMLFAAALRSSRPGRRFRLLKASEELSTSIGVSNRKDKLYVYVVSSSLGGLGGAIYAYTQQFMSAGSASAQLSIYIVAACVIGGLGTVLGPVIGGVLVFSLMTFLGGFSQYQGIIVGLVLIAFVMGAPDGILSLRLNMAANLLSRRPRSAMPGVSTSGVSSASVATPIQPSSSVGKPFHVAPAISESIRHDEQAQVLRVDGVKRSFGGVLAVDDVSLVVRGGTVHGLVGSNGSGKTTLLNLISGFYRLDGGSIWLGSRRLDQAPPYSPARWGLGRTFQTPKLVDDLTVLDNVILAADWRVNCRDISSIFHLPSGRRADRQSRQLAMDAIETVGLADAAHRVVGETSHGTRRLVEVARSVALAPTCLLLDEPAAGLSAYELDQLGRAISVVAAQGVGTLLVEHNIPFVTQLASELTVLYQGKVLVSGPPSVLENNAEVAEAFLGVQRIAGRG